MSWRDVFDGSKVMCRDRDAAAAAAHANGYNFLAWNGDVLFIHPDGSELFHTGITTESLR